MDKVWILIDGEDQEVISVHSSLELATKAKAEYINDHIEGLPRMIEEDDQFWLREEMEEEMFILEKIIDE